MKRRELEGWLEKQVPGTQRTRRNEVMWVGNEKKFQQGTAMGPLDYTEKSGTNSTVDVILKNSLNLSICISKYGDYIHM